MCSLFSANIHYSHSLLTDWDDDDPFARNNIGVRQERTVVLKGLFTLEELQVSPSIRLLLATNLVRLTLATKTDVEAILDIKDDVRNECSKFGEVTNVVLYDLEPAGVVTVKFAEHEDAQKCISVCVCPPFFLHLFQSSISRGIRYVSPNSFTCLMLFDANTTSSAWMAGSSAAPRLRPTSRSDVRSLRRPMSDGQLWRTWRSGALMPRTRRRTSDCKGSETGWRVRSKSILLIKEPGT